MSLKAVVLGFLNRQPMSGYELNKALAASADVFWTTDQSQIYRMLHRLYEDGLVEVERVAQRDHPDKKMYHITARGQDFLLHWLATPQTGAETPVREPWLAQLFFADMLPHESRLRLLEAYLEEERRALDVVWHRIGQSGDTGSPSEPALHLLLDYRMEYHQFRIYWLKKAQQRLRQQQRAESDPDPAT